MRRKTPSTAETIFKSGTQSEEDPLTFVMSTQSVDKMGDIIIAKGWQLKDFKRNPIALFAHNHLFPVGTWDDVRVEGKRLLGTLKMARKGTSKTVDEVRSLLQQRVLKSVSVGFTPIEYAPTNKAKPYDGYTFSKSALNECSIVAVPANPEALAISKGLGISKETQAMIFARTKRNKRPRKNPSNVATSFDRARKKLKEQGFDIKARVALMNTFKEHPDLLHSFLRGEAL